MIDGTNNLLVKNTTCMEGMVKHFIEDHGFTKLCFMTGSSESLGCCRASAML